MRSKAVFALGLLNVLLLANLCFHTCLLILRRAQVRAAGRSEYLMISGELTGMPAGVVFILDTRNVADRQRPSFDGQRVPGYAPRSTSPASTSPTIGSGDSRARTLGVQRHFDFRRLIDFIRRYTHAGSKNFRHRHPFALGSPAHSSPTCAASRADATFNSQRRPFSVDHTASH